MDDSKKQLSSGQKKRKQYRKHFLPEKKKEKMKQKEKIKRTFEFERKRIESDSSAPPVLDDDIVIDEDDRARTKKPKISKMDQERHRRIEQVTKSEKEKLEKQQREKKRREKNKLVRKRTAKGNVVMKHVIGGLLEKIQKEKGLK